jgi:hypothetical protein
MPKTKSKFIVQQLIAEGRDWSDTIHEAENTAAAIGLIKEHKLIGKFRIISVRALVSTEEETKVNLTVEGTITDND